MHHTNKRTGTSILYTVNTIVTLDNFNDTLDKSFHGIFFKSITRALYFRKPPPGYTGTWEEYDDNGNIVSETQYLNGKLNGTVKKWFNGQKVYQCEYVDDILHGIYQE